ncbi:MAG: acetate/propionate family kinase [Armatimonadota bacterium]
MLVLVLNSGSSSVKYQIMDMPSGRSLASGIAERVGTASSVLTHQVPEREALTVKQPLRDHTAALGLILRTLVDPQQGALSSLDEVQAVGHRFVHGGEYYAESCIVTAEVLETLEAHSDLAPLHNPPNLAGIHACQEALPGKPQVLAFDNGLHASLPPEAYLYALPYELYERHRIRRYGFHGLALRSAFERAEQLLGRDVSEMKVVTLMLGSGNTASACDCGRSVEISTGFTPHEGLVASTRAGDMDAAIIPWLMDKDRLDTAQIVDLLNRRSGWLGISGISQDLRDVIAAAEQGHERAQLALAVHAHRARKYVGAYAATMGGIDLLIFAGSVGLKSPLVRANICRGLEFMGLTLDPNANSDCRREAVVSAADSPRPIVTVEISEELIIARDTWQLVSQTQ